MKPSLTILLLFLSFHIFAQHDREKDSLLTILDHSNIDSVKVSSFVALSGLFLKTDPEKAVGYAKQGLAYTKLKQPGIRSGDLYFNLGQAYNMLGKDDSAILAFGNCIKVSAETNNIRSRVSSAYMLGFIYTTKARYREASEVLFNGLSLAEASGDPLLAAKIYGALSNLFYNQANYSKAIAYGEKGLAIFKKNSDPMSLGGNYLNLGLVYADSKNAVKAEQYYKEALRLFQQADAKLYIATTYGNLSLLDNNTINSQIRYLMAAQKIWDAAAPDNPNAVGNVGNLGAAFLSATRDSNFIKLEEGEGIVKDRSFLLKKAESYLTTACNKCRQMGFDRDLHYFTGQLAKVEQSKGNYKKANEYLNEYIRLNDSLYSQENKNKIAAVEGEREVAIRDKQIELNNVSISAQRKVRGGLMAGVVLLAVIGLLLYWQSQVRRNNNRKLQVLNHELDEANKMKARFFGIISHDLRSPVANLVSFLNLQQEAPELFSKDQAAAHREAIRFSAESLLETMEGMLQWSKSQMNHFKPQLKQVTAADMFAYVGSIFSADGKIRLVCYDPEHLSFTTDEDYLRTILHNLTSNAVKAVADIPGALIEWRAVTAAGKKALIITDNGPGANPQQVDALYDDAATVSGKKGLGLHLVRDLARAILCTVSFSSEPGAGASFTLTFDEAVK